MATVRFIVRTTQEPVEEVSGNEDDSSYARTFTENGESPPEYNENSKIGNSALVFTGNDQTLTTPANSNLNLGTTFTIDFWMRFDPFYAESAYLGAEGGAKIISNYEEVAAGESTQINGYEIGLTGTGELTASYYGQLFTTRTITSSGEADVVTNGGWHHVCLQRGDEVESNVMRLFLDGVSVGQLTMGPLIHNEVTTLPWTIGARAADITIIQPFQYGTLDELEVINGVAKFSTGGFTPPTTANTSTANHLVLLHFEDSNPEPTRWYEITSDQYWFNGGSWSGSSWLSFGNTWTAQYGWNSKFRPEKIKITGTPSGGGTIQVTNNDDFNPTDIIASATASTVITMDTTFATEDETADDIHYLKNMVNFSAIGGIFVDAKSVDPIAS